MRRSLLFWLLPISALCVFAFSIPVQAYVPAEEAERIDSIVLTVAPSCGAIDEVTDNVAIIRPSNNTVLLRTIWQKDDTVLQQKLFRTQTEDVAALVSLLYAHDFFDMAEYLETGVDDGHFTWITVSLWSGESKRVGGLVAEEFGPDGFIAIRDAIGQVLQNSVEQPDRPADEELLPERGQEGSPLLAFCGAQEIVERTDGDPPSRASVCHYTVAGGTPFVAEDEATARRVVDALANMTVYAPDGWGHTDDYLVYSVEWADGTSFSVTFQQGMLLGNRDELYPVSGFDALVLALPPMVAPSNRPEGPGTRR